MLGNDGHRSEESPCSAAARCGGCRRECDVILRIKRGVVIGVERPDAGEEGSALCGYPAKAISMTEPNARAALRIRKQAIARSMAVP